MFKTRLISRNQKQAVETLVLRTAFTMKEQVVSTGGRATRAIVRVRARIGESPEEKTVNPRASSCAHFIVHLALTISLVSWHILRRENLRHDVCGQRTAATRHQIHRSRDTARSLQL